MRVCIVGDFGKLAWTVAHASERHVGDGGLHSTRPRRLAVAPFGVDALTNGDLVHEAPAILGCQTPSALAHSDPESRRSAVIRGPVAP